jgi:hypothetical protein
VLLNYLVDIGLQALTAGHYAPPPALVVREWVRRHLLYHRLGSLVAVTAGPPTGRLLRVALERVEGGLDAEPVQRWDVGDLE